MKPKCELCAHWNQTEPKMRIGVCRILNKRTEWCAGSYGVNGKWVRICQHFSKSATTDEIVAQGPILGSAIALIAGPLIGLLYKILPNTKPQTETKQ